VAREERRRGAGVARGGGPGRLALTAGSTIGPGQFGPARVRSPGGHAAAYEDTERRLATALARVPITRVYDATAVDWLGLPVWAAVTPLALDLTVHAGKGTTPAAARISAIMEAVERVCAERLDPWRELRVASYRALVAAGEPAIDPELFDLPFETAYRPGARLTWIGGHDLLAGGERWVPLDLVLSPAREGICTGVETNGLAAGNCHTEAALHALYELVERDALARQRFLRRCGDDGELPPLRVLARETLPAWVGATLADLRARGIQSAIQDLSHDLDVPVLRATLYDGAFPGREGRATVFEGLGADLDAARALERAVCEAAQAHTATVLGARDAIEGTARRPRLDREAFVRRLTRPTASVAFEPGSPVARNDLRAALEAVLGRLRGAGLGHCVVVDLTREELGIPVVRVLVPGLAGPYGETSRRPARRLLRLLA
jgi:YcaO-like protein with predicted kinase domain